ncbi:hypothetical protein [Methylobacterium platani]|uniref:Uncharacterized protein n=1 Tax=Methylobacterium platani TaxID=427683 RepID=A0A179SIG9_9HYPH|nr:hypothetical protein [Methylobacterium platani]OAS26334.1 hypothetical protein A5481_06360 [Methylobacterium platani]
MSRRVFAKVSRPEHGRMIDRFVMRCSECPAEETLGRQNYGPGEAVKQVPKKFSAKGWTVGGANDGSADLCPACSGRHRERPHLKLVSPTTEEPIMKHTKPADPIAAVAGITKPSAEPLREMSRDDRRVIFAKLDDVYVDEKTGYSAGWTDDKVATDLGVPRAWVATIRDENFGPGVNEELTKILGEVGELTRQHEGVKSRLSELQRLETALAADIARITGTAKRLQGLTGAR